MSNDINSELTKAIIPVAGLGTRFLPLSKTIPKELFPLLQKPLVQYAVQELKDSGISDIVFIVNSNRKFIEDYFKRSPKIEKILEERKEEKILAELKSIESLVDNLSISYIVDKPLGDGHAVLQAKKLIGDNPAIVVYPDDIVYSAIPATQQLINVFKTTYNPIVGLFKIPEEKLSSYGVIEGEKIADKLYKIKSIVEKPPFGTAPSNLASLGRRIITPEVFSYIKKTKPNKKGEVILFEALAQMVRDGKVIYGYELDGKWLECGSIKEWTRSSIYLALKDPVIGAELKQFIKEENLLQ